MQVRVYNGEKFQRGKLRYLVFTLIFAGIFLLSFLNNNFVGAVLIFFLLGGYFYYSTINNQVVTIKIEKTQLLVGTKTYPRNTFVGYVLEIYPKTQQIKNIVLLTSTGHKIHTFDDTVEHVQSFVMELDQFLPMIGDYNQTTIEKLSRKMKL